MAIVWTNRLKRNGRSFNGVACSCDSLWDKSNSVSVSMDYGQRQPSFLDFILLVRYKRVG